ncbi:MAG: glutaminyl-peptide cyclotransferase [Chitinophagaceae bacterium]|nr:glutaminyl-peptide cyclotransferase [Chitinophagaceae bacterium]
MLKKSVFWIACVLFLWSCNGNGGDQESQPGEPVNNIPPPALVSYSVLNIYPHDTSAFTQGLVYYNNQMYEGTGQKNESTLRKVDYKTGRVEKRVDLESTLFGEGITILNDTLYQLTWQDHIVLVYSLKDLKPVRKIYWANEGWGITHDGTNLIISDGTDKLYFVRPGDFKLLKIVSVSNSNGPVYKLNELEYIDGYVYANQWETDNILKIDPHSGFVTGVLDFKDALKKLANINYDKQAVEEGAVLNGIAWDAATGHIFVTGKRWPKLLEIKLN